MSQPAPRHRIKAQERAQKWRSGRESSSSGTLDLVDAVERSTSSSPHRGDAELPIQSISGLEMNDNGDESNVEQTNIVGNEPRSNVDLRRDDVSFKPNGASTSPTVEAEPLRVSSDPLETFESILTHGPLQLSTLGQPLVTRRKMNEAVVLQNNGVSARSSSSASALPPPPIRSLEDVYPPGIVDVPGAGDESDLTELVDDQSWRDEEASQRDDFEPFRVYDTEDGIPFDDSKIKINTPVRPSPVLPAFVRGIHNRTPNARKANDNSPKSMARAATAEEARAVVSAPKLTALNHSDEESDNGRVAGDDNVDNDDGLKMARHVASESPDLTMNVAPPSRYSSAMKLQDVRYPFGTDDDNPDDDDDAPTTRHAAAMAYPLSSLRKHEQASNRDGGSGDGIVVSKDKNKPKEEHLSESSLRREEVSKSKNKISNRKRLPSQSCLATVIVAALICILVAGLFCLAYFVMPSSLFKSAAPPTSPTVHDDAFSHMDRNDGDESIRDLLRSREEGGGRGARDFHSSDFSPLSSSSLSPSAYSASTSTSSSSFWSKFWFYTPLETGILDDVVGDDDDDRSYLHDGSADYKRPSSVSMDHGAVDPAIFESLKETRPGAIQPRQPYDPLYYDTNSDRDSPSAHHAPYSAPPPTRQQSHRPATPTSHAPLTSDGPGKNDEEQDRKRSKMHWVQRPARLMSDEQILKQTMNSVIYLMQWLSEQKTAANFDFEALNNLNAMQKSCLNELTFGPYRERLAQKFVSQMILQTCTAPSEELLGRYANLFFGTFDDYEPFVSMLHATET